MFRDPWRAPGRLRATAGIVLALALFAALSVSALGSNSHLASTETQTGSPNLATGKTLFKSLGCGSCHTLKPAGSKGTLGPNLDQFLPPYSLIVSRITNGSGLMPAYKGRLTTVQVRDIAAFVYSWTSRP